MNRNFLKFILAGLFTVLAGEFQINVLVLNKGVGGYFGALFVYIFFLTLMYLFGKFLERKISLPKLDIFYYLTGGILGLAIEWFMIGNAPWVKNGAIQAGMFAWWSATFLVPRIFTDVIDDTVRSVRRRILILLSVYSLVSTFVVIISPQVLRPGITAIMFTIVYIVINFQFVPYLARNGFSKTLIRGFVGLIVIIGVLQLLV